MLLKYDRAVVFWGAQRRAELYRDTLVPFEARVPTYTGTVASAMNGSQFTHNPYRWYIVVLKYSILSILNILLDGFNLLDDHALGARHGLYG